MLAPLPNQQNVDEPASSGSMLLPLAPGAPRDPLALQRLGRLKRLVRENHDLVWRTLQRLGVPDKDVEDAVQRVFIVVGSRLDEIELDRERSFVFGAAMRISSEVRRSRRRHPEELVAEHDDEIDPSPGPEALLRRGEMLALLGTLLKRLPPDQRAVFILHEFEEMSLNEIAAMLEIPVGTAASRLRRARCAFEQLVSRFRGSSELEEP